MSFDTTKSLYDSHVTDTYARYGVSFVSGKNCTLYDEDGKAYIDFAAGIGVNSVGYAHPEWVKAVAEQAAVLAHTSNLYYSKPGGELAVKLVGLAGLKRVFYSNSGAEANEGMIKCARKYSADKYGPGRHTIVTLDNSFHGRTVTTLAATGQDVFHKNFHPLTEGFVHAQLGDIAALEVLGDGVCAIILECVQGEGGVLPCPPEYLKAVADLCAERDWLLLIDEVQTGIGRCGKWFAFQNAGILPDVVSFAKGIAGGLPMGGFIVGEKCEKVLAPGDHATTFGGNLICCSAALATLKILEGALPRVQEKGDYIRAAIMNMGLPMVKGTRGAGLMIGVSVEGTPKAYAEALLKNGLVALTAGKDAIRMLPPLVISYEEIDKGLEIFKNTLTEMM